MEEKKVLETELGGIGVQNPKNDEDWIAKQTNKDQSIKADSNEVADKLEEYETNEGIISNLETQLIDVNAALEKIKKGTYCICEVTGHKIEIDRLEANPAARTCKEHMND